MKNDCGENYADEEDNHDNGDSYYVYGGINLQRKAHTEWPDIEMDLAFLQNMFAADTAGFDCLFL